MKSLLITKSHPITRIFFPPVIPLPATGFDTIHPAFIDYQDVLFESAYHTDHWPDQLQLQHAEKFGIFLGVGRFPWEKGIACCGGYLEEYGVGSVVVENKLFGVYVVKSVLNGSNYVCRKRGISLIAETLEHLQSHIYDIQNWAKISFWLWIESLTSV